MDRITERVIWTHFKINPVLVVFWILIFIVSITGCHKAEKKESETGRIVIAAKISKHFFFELQEIFSIKDVISIRYEPFQQIGIDQALSVASEKLKDEEVKWVLSTNEPLRVTPPFGNVVILNPGDSIYINYTRDVPIYSGRDKPSLELLNELMRVKARIKRPEHELVYGEITMPVFNEWNHYFDAKINLQDSIIRAFRDKISEDEYMFYRVNTVGATEDLRLSAFSLLRIFVKDGYLGSIPVNLSKVWDSTQCKPWRQWLLSVSTGFESLSEAYSYNKMKVLRNFDFNTKHPDLDKKEIEYLNYATVRDNYKGLLRERLMLYILDKRVLDKKGAEDTMTKRMLEDYYSQPGYSEYKQWMKREELKKNN